MPSENAGLIENARIITTSGEWERGWLRWHGSEIVGMGPGQALDDEEIHVIDAQGLTLLPGFVDDHVHGAIGHDAMDANAEGLQAVAQFYAQHGVTAFLATTWTDTSARITKALETIAAVQGPQVDGATLVGAHLEGPYLNPQKCGAQNLDLIRRADPEEAMDWLEKGVIRLLSLAPEYDENLWLIQECANRGITVSVAHSAASYDQVLRAVQLGLRHSTHTFNAMSELHHRNPGTVGAVLTTPEIRCELIADNIHVHPAMMKLLLAAKGLEGVILITDAIRGTGMPDGEYPVDDRTIVVKNGVARLPDGTLAGSTVTMEKALANFVKATGRPLADLWQVSSLNAAKAIGISNRKGSLEVQKDADLVLLDDDMNVYMTVAEGRIVYRRSE
ncbi:MAG: N-acetylglucosamine-6-phosphate deacetylase [Chloroflexi bacterium]|nr:N-acetylglucosamine-6-phosphate deacetylase [Chloroflexota bacterium]